MNRTKTFLLLMVLAGTGCSRNPDSAPGPIVAGGASPASSNITAPTATQFPGKILNQKMEWPDYYNLRCVPAPSHYTATTERFEQITRSSNILHWETVGRYIEPNTSAALRHVADFEITYGDLEDMQLVRDDNPRPPYRIKDLNFPLKASAIKQFVLVSYLNEGGVLESHFSFDVTLVSKQGKDKTATYNCLSDQYESKEDIRARQVAEAMQKKRAFQMKSLARVQQAGGRCDAIAVDMESAINAGDDRQFSGRQEAAIYYGCLK